jgi:SNF2 family DNA or RNA helicase
VRLAKERLLVRSAEGFGADYEEFESAVLELSFDYDGTRIRSSDDRRQFFLSHATTLATVTRDASGEERARRVLESFGAVELACLDAHAALPDSTADYLLHVDGNVHTWCSFAAYAVPQLRALGFRVEFDADYPYRLLEGEPPWYSHVVGDERSSWFELELGIEIEGRRVNLLPALLELLDRSQGAGSLNALRRMPARVRAVRVDEHHCLALAPEQLTKILEVLIELYQGERSSHERLRFQELQAASLVKLEQALGQAGRLRESGSQHVRRRGRDLAAVALDSPSVDVAVLATLRPYQREGLAWLQKLRALGAGGVLADDMGLGKTLQTIALLAGEKQAGRLQQPSLLLMPTSLVGNWQREIAQFAPSLRVIALHGPRRRALFPQAMKADVVLTTYPLLLRDLALYQSQRFGYVVLDEAQVIKNRRSLVTRAVTSLASEHRLCLSGTPIENNLEELWSLFEFLMPGFLGSPEDFRARYRQSEGDDADACADELQGLRQRVAPFVLRRMKEQVARELPPKTELVLPIELAGAQRELYESIRIAAHADVRRAVQKMGLSRSTIPILDALMKLRQVCCDPRLVAVDAARGVRASAKYERFFELLSEQLEKGRRVLVFSQFTRMLALLAEGMRERDIRFVALTGSTVHRQRPIDDFSTGKADVFLISLKAGGTGLNLTSADTVIHYDPWWNPAAQAQATDRAYRIGQTKPVFVHSLIIAGSVEERMLALQRRKRSLADAIIGPQPSGLPIADEELDRLFLPIGFSG